jgi:hypothetical protein
MDVVAGEPQYQVVTADGLPVIVENLTALVSSQRDRADVTARRDHAVVGGSMDENLWQYVGDSNEIAFQVFDHAGQPKSLADATVTLRIVLGDDTIEKTNAPGGGIEITDEANGKGIATIEPADTADIAAVVGTYSLHVEYADGAAYTVARGAFQLREV